MKTKMKRKYTAVEKRENRQLYLLMLPVFILIAVFCYAPMFGIVIAFQDYWPGDPFFGEGAVMRYPFFSLLLLLLLYTTIPHPCQNANAKHKI